MDAFLMLMLFCLQKTQWLFGPETWEVFILRMLLSHIYSHRAQNLSECGPRWPLSTPTVSRSNSADAVQDRAHSSFIFSWESPSTHSGCNRFFYPLAERDVIIGKVWEMQNDATLVKRGFFIYGSEWVYTGSKGWVGVQTVSLPNWKWVVGSFLSKN